MVRGGRIGQAAPYLRKLKQADGQPVSVTSTTTHAPTRDR